MTAWAGVTTGLRAAMVGNAGAGGSAVPAAGIVVSSVTEAASWVGTTAVPGVAAAGVAESAPTTAAAAAPVRTRCRPRVRPTFGVPPPFGLVVSEQTKLFRHPSEASGNQLYWCERQAKRPADEIPDRLAGRPEVLELLVRRIDWLGETGERIPDPRDRAPEPIEDRREPLERLADRREPRRYAGPHAREERFDGLPVAHDERGTRAERHHREPDASARKPNLYEAEAAKHGRYRSRREVAHRRTYTLDADAELKHGDACGCPSPGNKGGGVTPEHGRDLETHQGAHDPDNGAGCSWEFLGEASRGLYHGPDFLHSATEDWQERCPEVHAELAELVFQ